MQQATSDYSRAVLRSIAVIKFAQRAGIPLAAVWALAAEQGKAER